MLHIVIYVQAPFQASLQPTAAQMAHGAATATNTSGDSQHDAQS